MSLSVSKYTTSPVEERLAGVYWRKPPMPVTKDDNSGLRLALSEFLLRCLITETSDADKHGAVSTYESFLRQLYISRYRNLYPPSSFSSSLLTKVVCLVDPNAHESRPSTITELKTLILSQFQLQATQETLDDLTKVAKKSSDEIMSVATTIAPRGVVRGFLFDYTEELLRWAVGPDKVATYLYKCSSLLSTHASSRFPL